MKPKNPLPEKIPAPSNELDLHLQQRDQGNRSLASIDKHSEMGIVLQKATNDKLSDLERLGELGLQQNHENSGEVVKKLEEVNNTLKENSNKVQKVELQLPDLGDGADEDTTGLSQNLFKMLKGKKGDKGDPFVFENFTPEQIKLLKGADGYTPKKGVDYFDGKTPVKGVDYKDGTDGYTPVKGVDYFDGAEGKRGLRGLKGEKGDPADIEEVKKLFNKEIAKISSEDIMAKIKGKYSFTDLIDIPLYFKNPKSSKTVSLRELDDVDYTGLSIVNGKFVLGSGSGGGGSWGSITGTLSAQTDLQNALDLKENLANKSTSTSLGTSDTLYPSQKAVKTYVDNSINSAVVGLLDDRGNYDASGNVYPSTGGSGTAGAILKGDLWTISVAGTLGGVAVTAGDVVRALVDSPGSTSSNWAITENNIGYVAENSANKATTFGTINNTLYPTTQAAKNEMDTRDTANRSRSNHTGTQLAATISDFASTVIATVLSGFAAAGTRAAITSSDTILSAFGKAQKYFNDLSALAFSGSASDLTGTKTSTFISDFATAVNSLITTAISTYFNKSVDDTDDITVGATNKFATAAEKTKVGFITITQPVDLDVLESDTATNNAKVSNATHTGEVTGSTALTVDKTAITNKTNVTAAVGDSVLISDVSDSGNLKKVTVQSIVDLASGGGGGPGDSIYKSYTQTAHGFSVGGDVGVPVYNNGTIFVKADNTSAAKAEVYGFIRSVPDVDTLVIQTAGYGSGITVSGGSAGEVAFLGSTPGTLTDAPPTAIGSVIKPLFILDTSTSGNFVNMIGTVIDTATSGTGQANVDFGTSTNGYDSTAKITVNTSLVSSSSIIFISPSGQATANHDPDDYAAEQITGYATNIVDGVSFDIVGVAPLGAYGVYKFNYLIQ